MVVDGTHKYEEEKRRKDGRATGYIDGGRGPCAGSEGGLGN